MDRHVTGTDGLDPRTPCLIGVATETWHPDAGDEAPEPLDMWEQVVRSAFADAGATSDLLRSIDSLQIVYCQSWSYDDPVGRLAGRLGVDPKHRVYSGIGGTTPQLLVNEVAGRMLAGELDLAVITGAEALDTRRRLKKAGRRPDWSFPEQPRSPFPFEAPFLDTEVAHEVFQAWLTFATWDIGRRASLGIEPSTYRGQLGDRLAAMATVAAANPKAWFPAARRADELITATPENRMLGYPYTKYMVSVMDVDMASALVLATHAEADALGVPQDRRVYLHAGVYATDPWYLAEHESYAWSPAMRAVLAETMRSAAVSIDDIAHLDLYSCFASSVNFAADALGLTDDRPVTVTGGLPFHGGAGSDYVTHSIATMADVLRADPGTRGLVTGVGMHMTKHVAAIWSTEPRTMDRGDQRATQAALDARPRHRIVDDGRGDATIATYSVVHERAGDPAWALVVAELADGQRCYAKALEPELLGAMEAEEWVGRRVELVDGGHGVNLVRA
jgi:acetyl-CoA C-acetyltransferase